MGASTGTPKMKVTAVFAAAGISTAFAVGSTLAYLTDAETSANRIGFLTPGSDGLITLTEARWESDTTGTGAVHGKAYAAHGILPGDTLAKDPKVTINAWHTTDGTASPNTQPLYVFMRVAVPKTSATAGHSSVLFDYTTQPGWALVARNDVATDADGESAAIYVYVYTGRASDAGTTTASHVEGDVMPRACVYGDDLPELFTSITYVGAADAEQAPTSNRSVDIDAYAIQVETLRDDDVATTYQLVSGEDVAGWA